MLLLLVGAQPLHVARLSDSSTSNNAAAHSVTQSTAESRGVVAMQQQQPSLSELVSSARAQISAALALLQTQVTGNMMMIALQPLVVLMSHSTYSVVRLHASAFLPPLLHLTPCPLYFLRAVVMPSQLM